MKIKLSCDNCKWNPVCTEERMVGTLCDEHDVDIFSDDYVDELIEYNREQYRKEYFCAMYYQN